MILDHQLAQQIVDRTMAIIGYNINVMNHAGIIIGSGEPSRLGQIHDGAILALKHGDSIELNEQSCASLKGVKPGINMILRSNLQVVGIVGITGNPEEIRDFANLVKMTAEMIIDQAALVEQLQWDRRHREEFISAWIGNNLTQEELADWAARLSIDLSKPRVAVIIEFKQQNTPKSLQSIRKVVDLLEYPERDNLVAVISMNEIVVLKPCTSISQWDSEHESQRIDTLLKRLDEHHISGFNIALGQPFPDSLNVHLSYQSAKQVLHIGKQHRPQQHKFLYEDLRLPVLLSPLNDYWQGEQLCEPIVTLKTKDKSGQLLKTLEALFLCNGNANECAKHLYIHRNTLRYRLDKISEITGLSTSDFIGLAELYIAYQISKLR
ncbi:CdaR family transcriptional regulator [Vibrio sp. T187]|uniref:PucR family transcriptional regulator n=1 Tax=Vibrio TaxID=662 RepID=UPI0010CA1604|nr:MULTISPECIES: CdaR family transcriptional regulator [Vibrio]MBW3695154.1 CdaR family transcriptional regulator [Vibrio sp. T187]